MKYTKEQLAGMSDFEVNKALCILLRKDVWGATEDCGASIVTDFCDKYSAIMPLAFEYKIDLIALEDGYWAHCGFDELYMSLEYRTIKFCDPHSKDCADSNPLRAIACCLILLLQDKGA